MRLRVDGEYNPRASLSFWRVLLATLRCRASFAASNSFSGYGA